MLPENNFPPILTSLDTLNQTALAIVIEWLSPGMARFRVRTFIKHGA